VLSCLQKSVLLINDSISAILNRNFGYFSQNLFPMKFNIGFVSSLILFCCKLSYAQPVPITIQFVEAQPLWEHLICDTSFYEVGLQPDINKYTVVQPHQSFRFGNDLIISSFEINYNAEYYGYILEQLDIHTGEIKWQNYSTYYNNGDQDYYKNLYLRPDGLLEMIGVKRQGPYSPTNFSIWNVGGATSSYVRKIFNYQTGELTKTVIGQDSFVGIIPHYLNFLPLQFDSLYLALQHSVTYNDENEPETYGLDFFTLNEFHNLSDTLPIRRIIYEPLDSIGPFSVGQPQFVQKIDDTTLVCLMFKEKLHAELTEAQLLWISIADLNNIKVIRREQVENYLPGTLESFLYLRFEVAEDAIYISQPYFDNALHANTCYLTCFDKNGDIIHFIPKCMDDGFIYSSMVRIYSNAEFDYLAGFPSRTGRSGFDILKLDRNSDDFQFISSLTSTNADEQFTRQMEVNTVYEDGLFIIGAYTKKVGPEQNSAVKFYTFNATDLGMDLKTSIEDPLTANSGLQTNPNPTSGKFTLNFDQPFSGNIYLFDELGIERKRFTASQVNNYDINLENFAPGLYFGSAINQYSGKTQNFKIILE